VLVVLLLVAPVCVADALLAQPVSSLRLVRAGAPPAASGARSS
jgi:hypothetical protein